MQMQNTPLRVELHVHLDGSVRPATLLELARHDGMELPMHNVAQLQTLMAVGETCESLSEYLRTFDFVLPYLQTEYALERVAYELVEQAAQDQLFYIEVRYAPLLHVHKGLTAEQVVRAVWRGLVRGERQFGVVARHIVILMRHHSASINEVLVEQVDTFRKYGVVAFDLAGDESRYSHQPFIPLFAKVRASGMNITIHAGEAAGPESIRGALEMGATRIGHGIALREDPRLMEEVIRANVTLEMCPISNLQTRAVCAWDQYPLKAYIEAGVRVTINTDNRTVSSTNLMREWEVAQKLCGLDDDSLHQLNKYAMEAVFVEQKLKSKLAKLIISST